MVDGNVTIDGTLGFDGKTHLVLADGCKLTVKNIDTTNLTIYGQSQGTGTLIAGGGNVLTPAIGQVGGTGSVSITINGGCVNAYSDTSSATGTSYMLERSVIGGYYSSHNDSVIINGGVVYTMDVSGSGRNLPENGTTKNNCIVGYNGVATVYGNAGLPDAGEIGVASFADNLKSIYISSGATLTGLGKYTAYPIDMYDLPNEFDISLKAGINAASTDQEIRNAIQVKSPYKNIGHTGAFTIAGLTTEDVTKITRNEDGTCTVTFTKNDKTVIKTLSLEKGKINSGNVTLLMDSYAYTGSPIEPEVTVTVAGKVLTKDKDYTVAYTNNTAIGTATVTVTGMGNYEGTAKRDFYINNADTLIDVEYVDEAGTVRTAQAKAISASSDGPLTLEGGWYFVQGTAQRGIITARLNQDSFLILPDGCSLDVTNGLKVQGNLTIYGQSGNSGKLSIKATTGILASLQIQLGNLTVNGGNLSVENYILGSAIDLSTGYTFTYNGTSENFTVRGDFTSSGTLQTERLTEDMINVDRTKLPEGSSGDLSETVGQCVTLTNPTYAGKEFVLTGWTQSVAKVDDITYTVTYTHAQRGTVSKTVKLTPPCAHPNLTYQDKGDGTCGGTCPDCNEAVTEPHRWSGLGVCANCGTQAVAKAERGGTLLGYYDESNLDKAFANDGATVTLLADVKRTNTLTIKVNCTLDLGGHNITFTGTENAWVQGSVTTMTIRGEGEIVSEQSHALVVSGSVTLEGGTFTSRAGGCAGVRISSADAQLIVTNEHVVMRNTSSGGYGLAVNSAQSVQLSAGTYSSIAVASPHTLASLLVAGYAYYKDGSPIPLSELADQKELTGPVTVQECQHTAAEYTPNENDASTHTKTCLACSQTWDAEDCDYGEYTHNDTSHTRICKLCEYQNVEAHNIECTAEASGTVIAVSEACKTCGYGKDLGTVTIHIPKLVYGDLTGVVTAENTLTEPVAVAGNVKNPLGETIIFSDHVIIDPPTMDTLTGNALLSAGEHKIKINIVIIRDENALAECELTFNVAPAPLTADMVTLGQTDVTYNGTEQKPALSVKQGETPLTEGTDYTVAYSNNVNVGTATVTVTGKGNYTGTIEKTFQIKPATLTVTPPTAALSYGQKLSDSTLTGGGATAPGVGNVAGNWEWANQEEQPKATGDFSATFKPTDTKNYETPESVIVNVTVNPAEPKITLTVPAHQVAGGEVTVTCKVENPYDASWKDDLPAVTLSCPGFAIENGKFTIPSETTVGTVITITANTAAVDGKYTAATKTATVTVTDKIPVTIHAEAVSRAYNGQPFTISTPVVRGQDGQTVADAAVAYTWSTDEAPVNAGDYTVTIDLTEAAKKTYAAQPLELSFSITKASATVTANSQTITKGDPAPAYTCTVSPTGADLGFTPTLSCAYTTESGAGEYPITVDGDKVSTDGNYTITYVNGKLTVKEPSSSGGGGGGDTPVNVTGVSLDRNSLTLTIGESFSLTVTITPSNADNKSVTWASGNSDVASVSGGNVTATGVGTTTITVTTQSGGHTASCTVTVNAKAYTITYDANGGAGTMRTGSAADGEPFTLPGCSFTPPEGKVFDAWAIGSADGTQAKAGSSHTFTEDTTVYAVWKDAPLVTYAVTYNANGGTGTMTDGIAPDQEAFVLPECGFTAPEGKEFDCWAIGSATGPKVQPGGGYTFTANTTVYALWKDLPPVPYDITGIVWQNGKVVPGATVQLKRGADVVAAQTTGADGGFTFSGVPAGVYNLVAIKDGITVTVMQEITSGSVNLTITLPNGKTNTVVEIKDQEGTPPVVVGEMENLFTDDTVYTAEDKEIEMVVEKQDASSSAAIQIEASKPAGQTIGLFLDLSIIKTVTPKDGQAETTSVTQVGSLIETLIPLPDEMQGKDSYTVYREHDGVVEVLPNSGNGERYTVSSDKKSITIYARKYSTYAVAWSDNGGDTPVDPGKPSRPSGGGSSVSTYAVTVSKTTYGKVVSSRTNASSGSTVTLTVTPDSGYTLDTLTVTDSRGNAVKLTDKGSGKYTFTMPSRAVTVTASFAPTVWNNPYTDVATGTWYYEAVRFVSENGLMGGYGKGLFGPNDNLSRAQLVQILYNHAGRPVIQNGSAFTDAAPGAWYADAVAWAAAEGIISGYGGGRFGPNDPITREQLAVMLWRYAGFPVPPNLLLNFPDANTASGYALDALRWAVDQGIISGYSNGRLEPKTPATRGQVAQILQNFFQKR